MRSRSFFVLSLCLLPLAALQACSGDDSASGGDDDSGAASDASPDTSIASDGGTKDSGAGDATAKDSGGGDSATNDASTNDASTNDAGGDAETDSGIDAANGMAGVLVSPAGCPVGLSLLGSTLYWAEYPIASTTCGAAVRSCPITGCASSPPALFTGDPSSSAPLGTLALGSAPINVFYTDNALTGGLWLAAPDGGAPTRWDTLEEGNGASIVATATDVYWFEDREIVRTPLGAAGPGTRVYEVGSRLNLAQQIAVDSTNLYVADFDAVWACALGTSCIYDPLSEPNPRFLIGTGTSLQSVMSDDTNVYFSAMRGSDAYVYRCPKATGCASIPPDFLGHTTYSNLTPAEQFGSGIWVNDTDVYWGSPEGNIWTCAKDAAEPCTPTMFATGVHSIQITGDANYLYWSDLRPGANGIYKKAL